MHVHLPFCVVMLLAGVLATLVLGELVERGSVPTGQTCPLSQAPSYSSYFFPLSQPANLTNCTFYDTNACCRTNYTASFGLYIHDNALVGFDGVNITGFSGACADDVLQILCGLCAPLQNTFSSYSASTGSIQYKICKSYCDQTFSDCANAIWTPTGRTVAAQFAGSSDDFCAAFFTNAATNFNAFTASGQCFSPGTSGQPTTSTGSPSSTMEGVFPWLLKKLDSV